MRFTVYNLLDNPPIVYLINLQQYMNVHAVTQGLVSNTEDAANACRGSGDLEALGRCLSTYWEQKKRMAPGE